MAKDTFTDEPVFFIFDVSEMEIEDDPAKVVSLNPTRVQEMLADYGDDKPQFPILRVESGVSDNGNNWPASLLTDIAEQINREEKPGYWGHIPPEQKGYVFPDVETVWMGAKVKKEGGKDVLYVKGYNHPNSKARRHRSMAKVTSWAGRASGPVVSGVRQIKSFALESIDWARPGANGMNARVVAWVSEMEGDHEVANELATATVDELRAANPSLFTLVRQEIEREHADSVSEMKEKADKADEAETLFGKLRKLLKIDDNDSIEEAVVKVVATVDDVGKGELKDRVLTALTKHIKGDDASQKAARSTLLRLIPVTEMAGKTDEEIDTYVEKYLSDDEDAKVIVTEMVTGAPAPLSGATRGQGDRSKVGQSGMVTTSRQKL